MLRIAGRKLSSSAAARSSSAFFTRNPFTFTDDSSSPTRSPSPTSLASQFLDQFRGQLLYFWIIIWFDPQSSCLHFADVIFSFFFFVLKVRYFCLFIWCWIIGDVNYRSNSKVEGIGNLKKKLLWCFNARCVDPEAVAEN